MPSSTPLTNPGARAPPNQWASRTASSMATLGGTSPRRSSRMPRRRMLRSTTAIRLSRQFSEACAASLSRESTASTTPLASASARSSTLGSGPVSRLRPVASWVTGALPESSQAYSSWSARARLLVSIRSIATTQMRHGVRREERRLGRFVSLVAGAPAGAFGRLAQGVHGEKAESDGQAVPQRDLAEAPRGLTRDVLEVRRLAPDHRAQGDEAAIPSGRAGRGRGDRQLESPRHPDDIDLVVGHARGTAAGPRALEQPRGDQLVIAAHQDRHAPGGAKAGMELGHRGQWARRWPSLSRLTWRELRFSRLGSAMSGARAVIWSP